LHFIAGLQGGKDMPNVRRQFTVVSADGRKFKTVEFATYRWERNADGEHCQVENDGKDFYTTEGYLVVPTAEPCKFRIAELELEVIQVDESGALEGTHGDLDCNLETLHDEDRAAGI
jgi:hypothetical protein